MKKSLIALAVLAASGAAMAQSSVSIYGVADIWAGSYKDNLSGTANYSNTKVESGGLSTSRVGLKGTEDLGGGLKVGFQLEQKLLVDTGATGSGFDREAKVNLTGNFGSVIAGHGTTPYYALRDKFDAIGGSKDSLGMARTTWNAAKTDYTERVDNILAYATPDMNGFTGVVAVSLLENKTATTSATNHVSMSLKYESSPFAIAYGYQGEEATKGNKNTFNLLTGSYDFGVAKLVASYQAANYKTTNVKTGDAKDWQFGVSVPVTSSANVAFGYAAAKYDAVGTGTDYKATGYSLMGNYLLSKRTDVYAGYKSVTKKNESTGVEGKLNMLAVGIRHKF